MPVRHSGGVSNYPPTFLKCRKNGHAWDDKDWLVIKDGRVVVGYDEVLVCLRCTTEKVVEYDKDMYRINRPKIDYVDGYLASKGEDLSRHASRVESMRRNVRPLRAVPHHLTA